jgi:hypothetical protein
LRRDARGVRGILRGLIAAAGALALAAPGGAAAIPGDPLFEPLTPADGASLTVDPGGIPVTFTCPVYRIADPGFPLFGGPDDYGVSFSRSTAIGADGRLRDPVTLHTGHRSPGAPEGQCVAAMGAGGSDRPQETPGTYYWQVWRICTDCPGSYEVGPVRRFVLRSRAQVRLGSPGSVYAGFAVIVPVKLSGVPNGTPARLQRRAGARWRTIARGEAVEEQAEIVVRLPRGSQQLRVVATVGDDDVLSPVRRVRVRPARRWRTRGADDGSYAGRPGGEQSVRFTVTDSGRTIRGFKAFVAMLCPGVTPGTFTTQIGTSVVNRIRVAPDGRFVGVRTSRRTAMRVRGRLRNRKITSGRVELSLGPCSGSVRFSARRSQ